MDSGRSAEGGQTYVERRNDSSGNSKARDLVQSVKYVPGLICRTSGRFIPPKGTHPPLKKATFQPAIAYKSSRMSSLEIYSINISVNRDPIFGLFRAQKAVFSRKNRPFSHGNRRRFRCPFADAEFFQFTTSRRAGVNWKKELNSNATKNRELFSASRTPQEAKADAEVHGQAGVTDGRDVLLAQQVLSLGVDAHPLEQLIAASQVQLGIA
jgi:hypothetical protein